MNALVAIADGQAVTTTMAIADGTENQHKNVMELVRTYLADLEEFGRVAFQTRPFETAGGTQRREIAILNEQQSTLLLTYMRNSDVVRSFKKQLVKEFWRMAQQLRGQPAIPQTLPEALRLAAEAIERSEKLALENKAQAEALVEQAPKVEALERFSDQDGKHNVRNAAKLLGVPERKLISWLLTHDWYYRDHSARLCAKSTKIQTGYLDTIPVPITRSDGVQTVAQPVVTQRGLAKLGELLAKDGMLPKPSGHASQAARKPIPPAQSGAQA